MHVTRDTQAWFLYDGKRYRVICITWSKDPEKDIQPTIVYIDDNNENQSINSGLGELTI